ncbi:hypothetical protein NSA47_02915 [Irregularibacter muris]|uniref:Uncharacterized protein n=1 Tax=Irregularibacter muris TaxID=1796619 RepID=A0AAE3HG30_9FIRM|nr:hypothetical protein [Irregularibacter muris]MCR1897938.1 hypothetical protein [Irregularibacter muris]
MNKNIQEYTYIQDSLNQSFIFYVDKQHNLIFNELKTDNNYTNTKIVKSNVADFAANIDKNNKLHLLYLLNSGELIYAVYLNKTWEENVVRKLDPRSNRYKYLNLFIHESHISIFYAFTNIINTNLWSIEHITKDSTYWSKKTILSVFSGKNFTPFYLDKDKFGNIFLIYRAKEYTTNHIYYTFYNIFNKEWVKAPAKISSSEIDNISPYLFIDSRDNIHVLWYSLDDNDYLLTYKQLSPMRQSKYHWTEINLPKITNSSYPPIMFEKNNKLYIVCIGEDKIHCLVSENYGLNWNLENEVSLNDRPIHLIKHFCNITSTNIHNKIHHCYGSINDDHIYFYLGENLNEQSITDKISSSFLENEQQVNSNLVEQKEQINTQNIEEDPLMNLKNDIVENQNELINALNSIEENSTSLKEVIDTITNIQKDIEVIKEKITTIEKNQNTKKKLFNF